MRSPEPSPRGPVRQALDFLSSIWTGVVLLVLLFAYSAIGSAVPLVRQLPAFEMTEFEWFHTIVFKALIGLICLAVALATLRRIPLKVVNLGVWMIHTGIIVLAISSVVYFGTKVEGDSPVARRQVVIEAPGYERQGLLAVPGNQMRLGEGADAWGFQVSSIDPQWELLSGDDKGLRAYSVNVMVSHGDRGFVRQLIAGYPQYTEDLVQNPEPGGQPFVRAKKVTGEALVEPALAMSLAPVPQPWMYLSNDITKSWALYLREVRPDAPPGPWVERPIEGLPLYNDWVADLSSVWVSAPAELPRPRPLAVPVPPSDPADPLPGVTIDIDTYLRYAMLDTRRRAGGDVFDPTVRATVRTAEGRSEVYELVAMDPQRFMEAGGRLVFMWAPTEKRYQDLLARAVPTLTITIPASGERRVVELTVPARDDEAVPFAPIDGTEYSYRVRDWYDRMAAGEVVISVAVVEIRAGDRSWVRWVCDDPARTRDLPLAGDAETGHMDALPLDPGIVMDYVPRSAPVTIVGGPEPDRLRLIVASGREPLRALDLPVARPVQLTESIALTIDQFAAMTMLETRPAVIPMSQRNRDARARFAVVRAEVGGMERPLWLPFHEWPVADASEGLGQVNFRPSEIALPSGRRVEVMFSRQREPLPDPVILEDFVMESQLGGFTGSNLSVRNWTSIVRFQDPAGLGPPQAVSVNAPVEHGGFWFFQSQWDPPRAQEGYPGLNFTVLGVGNRKGVNAMLAGCCLSVLGMIYAFYIKPIIKRHRQRDAYAQAAVARREDAAEALRAPAGARAHAGAGGTEP